MTERMDVLMTREYESNGETKTNFTKVGVAFSTKNGGWAIKLEAVPVPRIGRDGAPEISLLMMPPRDFDDKPKQSRQPASSAPSFESDRSDDSDGIPF